MRTTFAFDGDDEADDRGLQAAIDRLIQVGKKRGWLPIELVNELLSTIEDMSPDQIDAVLERFEAAGVELVEEAEADEDDAALGPRAEQVTREPPVPSELMVATRQFNAEQVKILLARGADPNEVDGRWNSLLHIAIDVEASSFYQTGRSDRGELPPSGSFVELFLEAGANPNALDGHGSTPLDIAIGKRGWGGWPGHFHPEAVHLLLRY
jgi:hypothetical protein